MSEMLAVAHFAAQETNRALRTDAMIAWAVGLTNAWGLPQHGDRPKAWDNLLAVYWASTLCEPDAAVLDAGAGDESAFLPGLQRLGFTNLWGCNTDDSVLRHTEGINHIRADITDLEGWDEDTVDFIACLSVIEHGVDVPSFLSEASRVLKPGGHLFVSTDYWETPVDCGGRQAFGAPVRIFSREDMIDLVVEGVAVGLRPTSRPDWACQDRVVNWIGLDYTFINLLFRKTLP